MHLHSGRFAAVYHGPSEQQTKVRRRTQPPRPEPHCPPPRELRRTVHILRESSAALCTSDTHRPVLGLTTCTAHEPAHPYNAILEVPGAVGAGARSATSSANTREVGDCVNEAEVPCLAPRAAVVDRILRGVARPAHLALTLASPTGEEARRTSLGPRRSCAPRCDRPLAAGNPSPAGRSG